MSRQLMDAVDAAWATGLGCDVDLLRTPGAHLVPGGPGFQGYNAVYMVRIDATVLVYCSQYLRPVARRVLECSTADDLFTVATLERIAEGRLESVHGPAWHGFVDSQQFIVSPTPLGDRVSHDDHRLVELRRACGEGEWAQGGFLFDEGVLYGVDMGGQLVAAGNTTPFRGRLADVGIVTHPDHRGRGFATRLASRMISDALPEAGVVRYRAMTANAPSLAVARSLGFVGRGENLLGRLAPN